jgi:hypothetical protein
LPLRTARPAQVSRFIGSLLLFLNTAEPNDEDMTADIKSLSPISCVLTLSTGTSHLFDIAAAIGNKCDNEEKKLVS